MKKEKACGFILFKGENFLLLRHANGGHWASPKGKISDGESELQTAKREVAEETGISNVEVIDGFREIQVYSLERNGNKVEKEVVYFLGKVFKEDILLSKETYLCS